MKPGKVRPIAICLIILNGKVLLQKGFDVEKKEVFYRPLGGKIKFGELGKDTVKRELLEEIKTDITNIQYMGTLENLFIYNGLNGHEIVRVYKAELVNKDLFMQPVIKGYESDGEPVEAFWIALDEITSEGSRNQSENYVPIYPIGLFELLLNYL